VLCFSASILAAVSAAAAATAGASAAAFTATLAATFPSVNYGRSCPVFEWLDVNKSPLPNIGQAEPDITTIRD
jgi:hypothetical protein